MMDVELLQRQFGRMGARLVIAPTAGERGRRAAGIDIGADSQGAYFEIRLGADDPVAYEVIDLRPAQRHLLLLARRARAKEKYLCGHDERHWFVCAVPDRPGLAGVPAAMAALQPAEVQAAARRVARPQDRLRRRNAAFVRQGEWFFIPEPRLVVDERLVRRNEPISRGAGSQAHICEQLYRHGGEAVMVCGRRPRGVTLAEYERLLKSTPEAFRWGWSAMRRGAAAYVRGRVSHPDHKTIVLPGWHRVLMNTEAEAPASRNVVFLD
jgi:hypothetical protein